MKRLWPGWLLCLVTAALFAYMVAVEAPAISVLLGGMQLPDAVPLGYDEKSAGALFAAFAADLAAAKEQGRQSASEAYLALHARSDLAFPPLLAASLVFCAFASVFAGQKQVEMSRLVSVGLGLVLALAFTYLACDFVENAVADAIFKPEALKIAFNGQLAFVLRVLTMGKYATLVMAFGLIAALWIGRCKRARATAAGV